MAGALRWRPPTVQTNAAAMSAITTATRPKAKIAPGQDACLLVVSLIGCAVMITQARRASAGDREDLRMNQGWRSAVVLRKGDLTEAAVDAIVNGNNDLMLGGGVPARFAPRAVRRSGRMRQASRFRWRGCDRGSRRCVRAMSSMRPRCGLAGARARRRCVTRHEIRSSARLSTGSNRSRCQRSEPESRV